MNPRYSIGIDLGTTNSVLAYVDLDLKQPSIQILAIPQVTAPNETESLPSLASFVYLPSESEGASGAFGANNRACVGAYARQISAEQPERTIAAAKSWLCHREVNRQDPILPWQAPDEVAKISPVEASRLYLEHLVTTWNKAFSDAPIQEQQVTLTVPASFDVVARELTLQAAREAGLPRDLILLEEPQAAMYHWIQSVGENWRERAVAGERILVCDCGGGTTDLTLLEVDAEEGELQLRRIAVGNHLLIGGDNMDLALAHFAAQKFSERGVKLNPWQSIGLWHACRQAKERLLSQATIASYPVSVLGRGSRLIGGTVTLDLPRSDVEQVLVDGFFPYCEATDRPESFAASGLQEIGLEFESDSAITKHVAAFLADHGSISSAEGKAAFPTRLLFNGGVFKSYALQERMTKVLTSWMPAGLSVEILGGPADLDLAVASGAAYYGWSKTHGGVRIRGGTAASYYVGIETSGPAIPGMPRPVQALCVAAQGMEEGTEAEIPNRQFGLVVGKPARFRFFSSHLRPEDGPGVMLKSWDDDELVESTALELTLEQSLPATGNAASSDEPNRQPNNLVPVRFQSKVTELGMFELWCVSLRDDQRWKLSFNVRPSTL